jgi:hypothetical protein
LRILRTIAASSLPVPLPFPCLVEFGGEAFTLDMLWKASTDASPESREHITYAIFGRDRPAPAAPPGPWTIDTQADLDAVRAHLGLTVA